MGLIANPSIIDIDFLYWQFLFLRKYLEETARAAVQKNINLETFKPIELWIPPLMEQKAIGRRLDGIQSDVKIMREQLDRDTKSLDEIEWAARERAYGRIA